MKIYRVTKCKEKGKKSNFVGRSEINNNMETNLVKKNKKKKRKKNWGKRNV